MFINCKSNSQTDEKKIGPVQCDLFSLTGVRFFQPKFMDNLNKSATLNAPKHSIQTKPPKDSFKQNNSNINSQFRKQNIDPQVKKNLKKEDEKTSEKKDLVQVVKQNIKFCKIRGLTNIGNTCYMNSIIQCLLNLSKFNQELKTQAKLAKNSKTQVTLQYKALVEEFLKSDSSPFTPSKFKNAIGKKKNRFIGNAQQDAQQFLTAFLQVINEETNRVQQKPKYKQLQNDITKKSIKALSAQWWQYYKNRDNSVICDIFQGQLLSTVTCKKCKHQSFTFDNMWGLPIGLSKGISSISELIRNSWSTQNEIEDYYCSKCQKHRTCTKKIEFFKLPQILVIQLKRFEYGKWKKEKIKTSVKISDTLNLSQCLHQQAETYSLYKLSSMVHHYGEVDYGHYTASVYKGNQRRWYLMNDSRTVENIPDSPSNTVYLLFYERAGKL